MINGSKIVSLWIPQDTLKRKNTYKNSAKTEAQKRLKIVPVPTLKKGAGGRVAHLWGAGKTSHSEKNIAKQWVKHTFGNLAKTRVVRKGELLRGMLSQGRPDPLKQSFKVLRSDSAKIKS